MLYSNNRLWELLSGKRMTKKGMQKAKSICANILE